MLPVDQVTLQRDQDARARERLQTMVRIARNREVPHSCEDDGGFFTCFWGIDLLLRTLELFPPFSILGPPPGFARERDCKPNCRANPSFFWRLILRCK